MCALQKQILEYLKMEQAVTERVTPAVYRLRLKRSGLRPARKMKTITLPAQKEPDPKRLKKTERNKKKKEKAQKRKAANQGELYDPELTLPASDFLAKVKERVALEQRQPEAFPKDYRSRATRAFNDYLRCEDESQKAQLLERYEYLRKLSFGLVN
jgi:hypothetical protein